MISISRPRVVAAALVFAAAPLLSACGGSANAAHDACMGEAATKAAQVEGVDPSTYEGDYDLMSLCDELVGMYEDEGRVVHVVGCIADHVGGEIRDGGSFSLAYGDGKTVPDLMDDPFSIGVCA